MHRKTIRKVGLAGVLLLLAGLFFALDLQRWLSFEQLKAQQAAFGAYYEAHTLATLAGAFVCYVLVTALSLPGAAMLSLALAALFGFWTSLLLVSFASSIGATLACLLARYFLRDWVQGRFGHRLQRINTGVAREGAFYLFTLRLIPAVPFVVINLAMGLTRMPLRTFYWVSQLGMLPGTVVYLNAGTELGRLESPAGILSPGLLIAFVLLGLFPLLAKWTLAWFRGRRGLTPEPRLDKE